MPDDTVEARTRRWPWALGGAIGAIALAVGMLASGAVDVDRIEFTGLHRVSFDEAIDAVGVRVGDSMPLINTTGAEESLRQLPWVGNARVRRKWPGTVGVEITERRAIALALRAPQRWALVDTEGRVLTEALADPPKLPRLSGIHAAPAAGGFLSDDAGAMLEVVEALTPADGLVVESVWRDQRGDLRARLQLFGPRAQLEVVLGDDSAIAAKATAVATVVGSLAETAETGAESTDISELDVSVPRLPVLRTGSDARPQTP